MTLRYCRSLALVLGTFAAVAAQAEPPSAQLVPLEPYAVWCTDISVPDGADPARYDQLLAEGVGVIDRTLGAGASTGTPFAASSRRLDKPVPGTAQVDIFSLVTVCARVSSPNDLPAGGEVRRETRQEVVFAQGCPLADRDHCIDRLRALLAQKLEISADDDRVQHLFWRAASSVGEPAGSDGLAGVLLAADKRRVLVAPPVNVTGNADAAAELSKPIDQQAPRPLIQARPSWYSVIAQPEDTWLVVAITLTEDMVKHLAPPPPPQPDPAVTGS
jgi:hypothetical protein